MVESIPWVKHIGLGAEQQYSTIGSKLITIMTFRCSDIQIVHHSESDNTSHLTWNASTLAGYFAPSKGGVSLERRGYITSPYRKETSEGRLTKEIRWPRLSFAEVIHTSCAYKHQRKKKSSRTILPWYSPQPSFPSAHVLPSYQSGSGSYTHYNSQEEGTCKRSSR